MIEVEISSMKLSNRIALAAMFTYNSSYDDDD